METIDPRAKGKTTIWGLFVLGCALGCLVGVGIGIFSVKAARDFFISAIEGKAMPDIQKPQTLERTGFHLQYPGNWKIDTADSEYEPDSMFNIDAPGSGFISFVIATDGMDPQASVDAHTELQTTKVMPGAKKSAFTQWGAFTGIGVVLKGKCLGLLPGTIRVFAFASGGKTITVIEFLYDEDTSYVSPGFALIERSFRIKGS